MFEKVKLKKELKECSEAISDIEKKRYRSQAALVQAILTNNEPDDTDVDYFNSYTMQIEKMRARIQEISALLSVIDRK